MALGFKFLDYIFHGILQDESQFNKYFYYLGIHFLKRKKSMCLVVMEWVLEALCLGIRN